MAQQNLNIGLSREQIRAAVQADFVELYAALNSAYGTNLVPRLLNSGLSDSQVLDFTRANFADLYAAVKAQGLTGAPRYLNAGLSSDQLRAATQANFTDLYTLLGGVKPWRFAATRCKVPTSSSSTFKQILSRTAHYAREDLTTFKIRVGNWYQQAAAVAEQTLAGATTFKVAVEYPIGISPRIRAYFDGVDNVSISGIGYADALVTVPGGIPRGELFRVWIDAQNPNGSISAGYISTALGEGQNTFTTTGNADQTLTGSVGAGGGGLWGPIAILAPTRRRAAILLCDSIGEGAVETTTEDEDPDVGAVARWIGPNVAYSNFSQGGASPSTWIARSANRIAQTPWATDVIFNLANNMLSSAFGFNATKTSVQSCIAAIKAASPSVKVWLMTCTPLPATSDDNFATNAGQHVNVNNPARVSYNAAVRAGTITGMDGYFEVSDYVEDVRDSGKFVTNGTPNYYTASDGVHMFGTAYRLIQAALTADAAAKLS